MHIAQAEAALRQRLAQLPAQTVGSLLGAMIEFYREVRFDTVPLEEDGDGLLLQWGTYDWGQGSQFLFDLTRQFFLPGEDEPFQLNMTMRFEKSPALSAVGESNRWCFSVEGISQFEEFMRASPPYLLLESTRPDTLEVRLEQV